MALQQFVKQLNDTTGNATGIEATPAKAQESGVEDVQALQSTVLAASAAGVSSRVQSDAHERSAGPAILKEEDCETLTALAAVQIKYGRPQEAVPYLMMLRRNDPANPEVARLLALALMKMGHWQQAEIIMDDLHGAPAETPSPVLMLYRSIAAFKQRKLDAARDWLQRFRNFVTGSAA